MRALLVVAALATIIAGSAMPASATEGHVDYRPPVDAPLLDTFRPPVTPYGPGNRGVDYATQPGQPVTTAADGEVVFAGAVGFDRHVVVLHADGVRTTYAFLGAVDVRRGDTVGAGQAIGTAHEVKPLHFSARVGEQYIDPLSLFEPAAGERPQWRTRLVRGEEEGRPLPEPEERRRLLEQLRGRFQAFVGNRIEAFEALVNQYMGVTHLPVGVVTATITDWMADKDDCTLPSTPPPPPPLQPSTRRIAVLVGGLGSSTGDTAVLDVDTTALGYAVADVHQFSYRADGATYEPRDTTQDIATSAATLAAHLHDIASAHPGVAIDVIAHSMGGLVAMEALTNPDHQAPAVATLVTLGTPHQGADLATAAQALQLTKRGRSAMRAVGLLAPGVAPDSPAVLQMAETSDFIAELNRRPPPPNGTRVVSVAARADTIVANIRSRLADMTGDDVVVDARGGDGWYDHERLPGSPAAAREIALAIAGLEPTCESLDDRFIDEVNGDLIARAQDGAGLTASYLTGKSGPNAR